MHWWSWTASLRGFGSGFLFTSKTGLPPIDCDSGGKEKQELLRLSAFASLALPVCNREINVYCQRIDNAL